MPQNNPPPTPTSKTNSISHITNKIMLVITLLGGRQTPDSATRELDQITVVLLLNANFRTSYQKRKFNKKPDAFDFLKANIHDL